MGIELVRCKCDRCARRETVDNGDQKPTNWELIYLYAMRERARLLCPSCIQEFIEWIDAPSR